MSPLVAGGEKMNHRYAKRFAKATNVRKSDTARRQKRQRLDAFFEKTVVKCYVTKINFLTASENSYIKK